MSNCAAIRRLCLSLIALSALMLTPGCSSSAPEGKSQRTSGATQKKKERQPIYDETADARAEIEAAIRRAAAGNKRVLVKFGGNWCGWCYKLHDMFHDDPVIAPLIRDRYELVLVDSNTNRDLMQRLDPGYEDYGYPWLAVLDARGATLVTQETGVLETGNRHDVKKVKAFLLKWQAGAESDNHLD